LEDPTIELNKLNDDEYELFEYWKYSADESDNSEDEELIFNKDNDIPTDLNHYYELTLGFGYPKDKNAYVSFIKLYIHIYIYSYLNINFLK